MAFVPITASNIGSTWSLVSRVRSTYPMFPSRTRQASPSSTFHKGPRRRATSTTRIAPAAPRMEPISLASASWSWASRTRGIARTRAPSQSTSRSIT
jgi:hypothetical protein